MITNRFVHYSGTLCGGQNQCDQESINIVYGLSGAKSGDWSDSIAAHNCLDTFPVLTEDSSLHANPWLPHFMPC